MSICFIKFPIRGFRRTLYIPRFGGVLQEYGILLGVLSPFEEYSGGQSQEMMGLVLGEDLQVITSSFHIKENKIIDEII